MTRLRPFDLVKSPLEGTNLIEASAGTGKTYTIAGLFLRLLLEQNLAVEHILVVTFTEAATEELRDRIRTRLREAVAAYSGGPTDDAFLAGLMEQSPDRKASLRILRQALRNFDQAAISTIHGFCRRVLHENAFESGIPVEGIVEKEIKGGFEIKIGDSRAFCPYSQMGEKRIENPEIYIGKHLTFKIIEHSENGRNILVSNRAILKEEHKKQIEILKKSLQEKMVVKGTIKSVQDFGAFVDIGGVQALLPISEISNNFRY